MKKFKTWKQCTNAEIIELYNKVYNKTKELYPQYFKECSYEFYIDASTVYLGRCLSKYNQDTVGYGKELRNSNVAIILSKYILNDLHSVLKTLCHEFGHAVTPKEHHSYLWYTRANKIAKAFNLPEISRLADKEETDNFKIHIQENNIYKYSVICEKCNRIIYKKRHCNLIDYPSLWRCSCGGTFKRNK